MACLLAVRNPHESKFFSSVFSQANQLMNRDQTTGWTGLVRVDGKTYTWMGLPGTETVNQTAFEYTSTKSIFTMNVADKLEMNITFLSPITPTDYKRQSLVFSYLNVEVSSLDGEDHDVQVYADISAGEWTRLQQSSLGCRLC